MSEHEKRLKQADKIIAGITGMYVSTSPPGFTLYTGADMRTMFFDTLGILQAEQEAEEAIAQNTLAAVYELLPDQIVRHGGHDAACDILQEICDVVFKAKREAKSEPEPLPTLKSLRFAEKLSEIDVDIILYDTAGIADIELNGEEFSYGSDAHKALARLYHVALGDLWAAAQESWKNA